jgi:hypothetical protein
VALERWGYAVTLDKVAEYCFAGFNTDRVSLRKKRRLSMDIHASPATLLELETFLTSFIALGFSI